MIPIGPGAAHPLRMDTATTKIHGRAIARFMSPPCRNYGVTLGLMQPTRAVEQGSLSDLWLASLLQRPMLIYGSPSEWSIKACSLPSFRKGGFQ
jgi:hypothetical protein